MLELGAEQHTQQQTQLQHELHRAQAAANETSQQMTSLQQQLAKAQATASRSQHRYHMAELATL